MEYSKNLTLVKIVLWIISSYFSSEHAGELIDNSLRQLAYELQMLSTQMPKITSSQTLLTIDSAEEGSYCINFMWVARDYVDTQQYIFPGTVDEVNENFLKNIFHWASCNKNATVHIWYDSIFLGSNVVQMTEEAIKDYGKRTHQDDVVYHIKLMDVRELPTVKANQNIFAATAAVPRDGVTWEEAIPVYFRVDLLRMIAAVHIVTEGKFQYFVYGDLDMKPLCQDDLFDKKTVENLKTYGIVIAKAGGVKGFENGFFIISNQNKNLLKAINLIIIDLSIIRAKHALDGKLPNKGDRLSVPRLQVLQQMIYDTFPSMFNYFFYLEKKGILATPKNKKPYDESRGLEPFQPQLYPRPQLPALFIDGEPISYDEDDYLIPTKEVPLPPANLNYD